MKLLNTLFFKCLLGSIGVLFYTVSCDSDAAKAQVDGKEKVTQKVSKPLLELLKPHETGIGFTNILDETNEVNFYRWDYLYNGGGAAIGDLDNDGLPEIYFTGTIVADKLYKNKGNFEFEDISKTTGISAFGGIKTGVTMIDINNDNLLDIYVCRSGFFQDKDTHKNLLFINQGGLKFKEMASAYGLDDSGNSIHSAFFDYDKDGDLDCYIASHPEFRLTYKAVFEGIADPKDKVSDKLYRNDNGKFVNVTRAAGVQNFGHGLGLAVSDMNHDGNTDVYVANDFQLPDFYYVNQGDGTFKEQLKNAFPHCSYFAMGTDVADFNNDGLLDIFIVEMLAADNKRKKTNMASMDADLFWKHVKAGFHYQYMRNTLQLNNGNGTFTDIADFAGVRNTDWSWAPIFADLDNDGLKDLLVTNGYIRDTQDKDYLIKTSAIAAQRGGEMSFDELQEHMKSTRIANYAYRNMGDYKFQDKSEEWGFSFSGFSNGASMGDLDNDGDLDIVVNNYFDPACIYKNNASETATNNFIRFKFEGQKNNKSGLGTKVTLHSNDGIQYQELQVTRGFQSCVEPLLHFGIGPKTSIDSVTVEWPDGKTQNLTNVLANQTKIVKYESAIVNSNSEKPIEKGLFRPIGPSTGSIFNHVENEYNDYEKEILLPHKMSQWGPALAIGDVNNDGLDGFYIGGAAGQSGVLFVQDGPMNLTTISSSTWSSDANCEDISAHFFDADNDGDQDLYVVSGGNEFEAGSKELQDRLYINQGNRNFTKARDALPNMPTSGGIVASGDYDNDGDIDLFVGGRVIPGKYPFSPRSYILENLNGKFKDVTSEVAPELTTPGLITSAKWSDFDSDGFPDLLIAGEWTGIFVFHNTTGKLENISEKSDLDKHVGWWFDIHETDIDKDGDLDYVIGNLGLNYKYRASNKEPFQIYCHDFDKSGNVDIVLGYYNEGKCFPVRGRQCSSEQMPFIKKKFPTYDAFGEASIFDVYGENLHDGLHYKATDFASSILLNNGDGNFVIKQLPAEAQFAPIMGIISDDFNSDGHTDLLIAGNLHVAEVETPRADGGTGRILLGNSNGTFKPISVAKAGIYCAQDVRKINKLSTGKGNPPIIIIANNNSGIQLYIQNQ